jgi:rhomboid protease GluP
MTDRQRQSILCPNCRRLISTDEPSCPHCGTSSPGSLWKNNPWTRGLHNPDQLIKTIIIVNAVMFVISLLLNPRALGFSMNPFGMLSPDGNSLLLLGASGTLPIARFGRWWSLLSANYLHGGVLHIIFNMIALRHIGHLVIQEYGSYRMIIIYTLSGIFGYWVSYLFGVAFTIGASAAVCGLIGAALYYGKSRGGAYGQMIYSQVGGWVIGIFVFGLLMPGINNWGHGGGLLGGVLAAFILGYNERRAESLTHKLIAGACVFSTLIVLGWAVMTGLFLQFGG